MFLIELIVDAIIDVWFAISQWIVPDKAAGKYTRIVLKVTVEIFSFLLFITMLLGFFAIISDDPYTKQIGMYMIFVPLGLSAVQIILGIIVRMVSKKK